MQIMQGLGVAIALSPSTGDAVRRALALAGMSADVGGLRIVARRSEPGGECQYRFTIEEQPNETDYVVQQHGVRVYVDAFSAQHVNGSTIDYEESVDGEDGEAMFTVTPARKRWGWPAPMVA
jgi:Fe-S cluster assembly iron-binding protein IscA